MAEDVLGHGFAATNLAGDVLIAIESRRSRLGALDLVSWDAHEQELTYQPSVVPNLGRLAFDPVAGLQEDGTCIAACGSR